MDSDKGQRGSGPLFVQIPTALLRIPERELNSSAKLLYGRPSPLRAQDGPMQPQSQDVRDRNRRVTAPGSQSSRGTSAMRIGDMEADGQLGPLRG